MIERRGQSKQPPGQSLELLWIRWLTWFYFHIVPSSHLPLDFRKIYVDRWKERRSILHHRRGKDLKVGTEELTETSMSDEISKIGVGPIETVLVKVLSFDFIHVYFINNLGRISLPRNIDCYFCGRYKIRFQFIPFGKDHRTEDLNGLRQSFGKDPPKIRFLKFKLGPILIPVYRLK